MGVTISYLPRNGIHFSMEKIIINSDVKIQAIILTVKNKRLLL